MKKYARILIVGAGGGREHALGWKIKQSKRAGQIYFAPGNGGTSDIGINVSIVPTDVSKLINFAKEEKIDLTIVASDEPLALGTVDAFHSEGLRVWGPTKAASELEWSKAYAKDFMKRHNIPTAKYGILNDFDTAKRYIEREKFPIVIKASGLALGKGVTIAQTMDEALDILRNILVDKIFGDAGHEVVIEEYLQGVEISIHAFSDGNSWKIFPASQDHKKVGDGNTGPNTGGMGAIAPLPFMSDAIMTRIESEIVAPTILGMRDEGREFVGCLYPGIMLTVDGPKVFEFNARMGDPETEAYMRILKTDILDLIDASIDGTLDNQEIKWSELSAASIALASGGYPGAYEKGKEITGLKGAEMEGDVVLFHSGTRVDSKSQLVTNGGRVLWVTTLGPTLEQALKKAYRAIDKISFEGMQYRKDIGKSTLEINNLNDRIAK